MKKLVLKKLSTFIVTAMLFSATANAQIIYTDVIPDSTIYCVGNPTLNYNLDLNNDANNDFILTAYYYGMQYISCVYASPLNGNALKDTSINTINVPIPLQFNTVIDSNLLLQQSWDTSGYNVLKKIGIPGPPGLWDNLSDYYLGLKLLQSGQTYYGWVRLRVDVTSSYASFIIRDYAYNSIPNQPILAGETIATGVIENSFASSICLFPNPANNHLTISFGSNNKKVEVTIADITGTIIYKTSAFAAQKIEVNTKEFAEGVYLVQVQSEDFSATKKLVIEK